MVNKRFEEVGYRPFQTEPFLADGLLPVARQGGELLDRASAALFRLAAEANQVADRQAAAAGRRAGEAAALAGRPQATVTGAEAPAASAPRVRGARFSAEVNEAVVRAAAETGEDAATLLRTAQLESGGNPRAKNPRSSAGGLFQQLDSNAKAYGVANKFDAYQSALGAAKFQRDNRRQLRKVLGREPTPGELYLAHQQGGAGASRLLKNPNARAVDIVGADAVRLNGGTPGMSAQQFANLWIRKHEGGAVLPRSVDELDPPAGAPTVTLAGGTFRPSGQDTIYGRAYDEAGARVYLQTVDTELRSTTSQLFERYRDDPAGLEKAFGDLKGDMLKKDVFPEIQADFEIGFDRVAQAYLGQARENARAKAATQDRADFIDRTSQLETDQARRVAAFDPKSPDAADAIASSQAAIDEHYDDAVRRGIMDPDDAAKAKTGSRREAALAFYARQADALDADGVTAMREKMRKDFAAGGIAGLDGEGWSTLDAGLERLTEQKKAEQARSAAEFAKRGDAFATRAAAGYAVDPAELAAYQLDAGKTPEGRAALEETFAKISAARAIRDMSLTQARQHVDGLRRQYGNAATDSQLRRLAFAEGLLESKRQAIATDAVSYAEAQGMVPATPLLTEAQTTDDVAGTMAQRVASAREAAQRLGISPRYLKAGEAKAVADAIRKDPATGVAMAGAIVAGAGAAAPDVLAEFGQDAPMVLESGAIIAIGGSARAAEDVVLGYGKGADGKAMKSLKPATQRENFDRATGEALAMAGRDRDRIDRSAAAIARKRIADEGLDVDSDEAMAIHERAVNEAAGATFDKETQYGGFVDFGQNYFGRGGVKVLVPPAMRADLFEDVLLSIDDADLEALGRKPKPGIGFFAAGKGGAGRVPLSPARTLRQGKPVAVQGGYAFAMGDPASADPQWIMGEDGKPFVLDVMALRNRLAQRTPGAWR